MTLCVLLLGGESLGSDVLVLFILITVMTVVNFLFFLIAVFRKT